MSCEVSLCDLVCKNDGQMIVKSFSHGDGKKGETKGSK